MNDLYNETIQRNGKTYRYDPDHDCWSPADCYKDMTMLEAWSPLAIMLVLCAIAVYLEYFR